MIKTDSLANLRRNLSFFAARGPAHAITYGRWRIKHLADRRVARRFAVSPAELFASLDSNVLDAGKNGDAAAILLANHLRSRSKPAFFFDERDVVEVMARIPAEYKAQTIRRADEVCQNTFDLRGAGPVHFDGPIDWTYSPNGNIDWRWDLNRHNFFETLGRAYRYTGDERYALKFRDLVCDWLAQNPAEPGQPNWNSVFEVALRSTIWVWALYYFRPTETLDAELYEKLAAGLLTHARYLSSNIELHVPNNHLLLEAKALAMLGILLPEFKEASAWRRRGMELFAREVLSQVCADGVHGERTTLYHRIIAGEMLEFVVLLENNHLPVPAGLLERFGKMVEFELALAKPDGTFPLLGDSAAADTHLRYSASSGGPVLLRRQGTALQESDYWLLGLERIKEIPTGAIGAARGSTAFPEGGYYVMRAGQDEEAKYLIFDSGPFGLEAMPNHGHADALSFELFALGKTMLLDPGYYSTALGLKWRNFFRGTRAHNTVVVDGLDQSELMDERRVYRPAHATCLGWTSNAEFDFVDGIHEGYERLTEPVTHRRQILFAKPHYWVVVDVLTGRGKHDFELYWHMAPGAKTTVNADSAVQVENEGNVGLAILPLAHPELQTEIVTGENEPAQGWVSFLSGEKTPAPVLRLHREDATPIQFCTVLYPYRVGQTLSIKVAPLHLEGHTPGDPSLTALTVETSEWADRIVIQRAGDKKKAQVEFEREIRG